MTAPARAHPLGGLELPSATPPALVLDTQIVLDLWLFEDPASAMLLDCLEQARLRWLATVPMREELARVLAYPKILNSLCRRGRRAEVVLQCWDRYTCLCPVPPKAALTCRDADDQKFVDLALAHGAGLLSKDRALLSLKKGLLASGSWVAAVLPPGTDCPDAWR